MFKLLDAFRTAPTVKLAVRIRAHARKHPFASCLLPQPYVDVLADAIHLANKEG
jgi:hypothetical protein